MVEGNVGLAFGLVIAAGLCTVLGGALVLCTTATNTRLLASALGASAGVMIYVSLVEIVSGKSVSAFVEHGLPDNVALRYATFSFFSGMIATWLLGKLVKAVQCAPAVLRSWRRKDKLDAKHEVIISSATLAPAAPTCRCCTAWAADTADHVELVLPGSVVEQPAVATATPAAAAAAHSSPSSSCCTCFNNNATDRAPSASAPAAMEMAKGTAIPPPSTAATTGEAPSQPASQQASLNDQSDLARMGALTALAVGLHNLPEGLATFVAALASPSAGAAIAAAIALHNIPEGVAVALPIYSATGSRVKGLAWCLLSGAAEPLGGLLGYLVLASAGMSPLAYAIMFGFVGGMMVYISTRELLPAALRYDPEDRLASAACVWGMAVMAASLLLFGVA